MQESFFFGRSDILGWRNALAPRVDPGASWPVMSPLGQFIKSSISSRTRDAVSWAAFHRLRRRYRGAATLAQADPREIERVIAPVTFADGKAAHLAAALRRIGAERGFDLYFLGALPLDAALDWLEALPGAGRKVAAATLNFSTLDRAVFVADSHVGRVLARLGLIDAKASPDVASIRVTELMADWAPEEFRRFHALMKRLGQTLCRPASPECGACPLADTCLTARNARAKRPPRA